MPCRWQAIVRSCQTVSVVAWGQALHGRRSLPPLLPFISPSVPSLLPQALRPVRAIAAMYRVPTRPMPTRHSHYVAGILLPLKVTRGLAASRQEWAVLHPGLD